MAGKQKFKEDEIGVLSKVTANEVELSASLVTLGGLQYQTGILSLNTLASGAGGLDVGPVSNDTMYCVYVVLEAGEPAIIASLNLTSPSGYTVYQKVGSFITDNSGNVNTTDLKLPIVKRLTNASGVYNTPNGVKYLKVTVVGGGGGGAGSSNNGVNNANSGGFGGNTDFGGIMITDGGSGGSVGVGGYGGDAIVSVDYSKVNVLFEYTGGGGVSTVVLNTSGHVSGGKGGDSYLGGGAAGQQSGGSGGRDFTGGGGAGHGTNYGSGYYGGGSGGGAGGTMIGLINNPDPSYSYTIGQGGAGGSGQVGNGYPGAAGIIIVEEYYE